MENDQNSVIMGDESNQKMAEQDLAKNLKQNNEINVINTCESTVLDTSSHRSLEFFELENKLRHFLSKCKIKEVADISDRTKRTVRRIQEYENEDRSEDAEKEKQYLYELEQLKMLNDEICLKSNEFLSKNIDLLSLSDLEKRMAHGLAKCRIKDVTQIPERIQQVETRIKQFENENRMDETQQEFRYLCNLKSLQLIIQEIIIRKSMEYTTNTNHLTITTSSNLRRVEALDSKNRLNLTNLLDDLTDVPYCAQRTIIELLHVFQEKLVRGCVSHEKLNMIREKLATLHNQIRQQELHSEQIASYLQDVNRSIYNEDYYTLESVLTQILKNIRPLTS